MAKTKIEGVSLYQGDGADGGQATTLIASYNRLEELLGSPNAEGDGYKVSTWWLLTFEGVTIGIRDYKATSLYEDDSPSVEEFRKLPDYEWSICCSKRGPLIDRFKAALQGAL